MGLWTKVANNLLDGIRKSTTSRLREEILLLYSELVNDNWSAVSGEGLICLKTFLHIYWTIKQWQWKPSFQNPFRFQREPDKFKKGIMSHLLVSSGNWF